MRTHPPKFRAIRHVCVCALCRHWVPSTSYSGTSIDTYSRYLLASWSADVAYASGMASSASDKNCAPGLAMHHARATAIFCDTAAGGTLGQRCLRPSSMSRISFRPAPPIADIKSWHSALSSSPRRRSSAMSAGPLGGGGAASSSSDDDPLAKPFFMLISDVNTSLLQCKNNQALVDVECGFSCKLDRS